MMSPGKLWQVKFHCLSFVTVLVCVHRPAMCTDVPWVMFSMPPMRVCQALPRWAVKCSGVLSPPLLHSLCIPSTCTAEAAV